MGKLGDAVRQGLWLTVALIAGWWLHGSRVVTAQSEQPQFQWNSVGADASLSVYYPSERLLYVYRGATTGSSRVNCAFSFKLGRQGDPLERTNCPIGKAY